MSWKLIGKPATQKVTKALATKFAEMEAAPCDRPLSERRLQVYRRLLAEGSFRPVTWATAECIETGGTCRVNGKHTSIMLSGMDTIPDFYVTIEHYECQTLEDVAKLYATFDSSMQIRTARDIYHAFASTVPTLRNVAGDVIALCATGIAYSEAGGGSGSHIYGANKQPQDRAEYLLEHSDFVLWVDELFSGGVCGKELGWRSNRRAVHLRRSGVIAAMFKTWQKDAKDALDFWLAVRDETGLTPEMACRKLAKYLSTTSVPGGGRHAKQASGGMREMFVKSLHGWNAWRNNETTNLKYQPDKDFPKIV